MDAKVTSADVRLAMTKAFPAEAWALMWEVAPQTGGGTRYADAVAVGLWRSHGHAIVGFEIKVSRSDFLSEMKQPEKSDPVMRYCNQWWLVCPAGMVKPDELPPTWGLMELTANGVMRRTKKAPKLEPVPVSLGFFASLCRRRAGLQLDELNTEIDRRVRDKVTGELEFAKSRMDERAADLDAAEAKIAQLEEITGISLHRWHSYGLVEDVKLAQKLRSMPDLEQHAAQLEKAAALIRGNLPKGEVNVSDS